MEYVVGKRRLQCCVYEKVIRVVAAIVMIGHVAVSIPSALGMHIPDSDNGTVLLVSALFSYQQALS